MWKKPLETKDTIIPTTQTLTGHVLTNEEVRTAIRETKDGKATEPDNFHSEVNQ